MLNDPVKRLELSVWILISVMVGGFYTHLKWSDTQAAIDTIPAAVKRIEEVTKKLESLTISQQQSINVHPQPDLNQMMNDALKKPLLTGSEP